MCMNVVKNTRIIRGNLATLECSYGVFPQHGSIVRTFNSAVRKPRICSGFLLAVRGFISTERLSGSGKRIDGHFREFHLHEKRQHLFFRLNGPPHSGSSHSERSDLKFLTKTANFDVYFVTFSISRGDFRRKYHEETIAATFRTSKFCINGVNSV